MDGWIQLHLSFSIRVRISSICLAKHCVSASSCKGSMKGFVIQATWWTKFEDSSRIESLCKVRNGLHRACTILEINVAGHLGTGHDQVRTVSQDSLEAEKHPISNSSLDVKKIPLMAPIFPLIQTNSSISIGTISYS